jgi:hypothetical protein
MKLLSDPALAPSQDLQVFFRDLRARWQGDFPAQLMCQIETDRDVIDAILYRRHTGSRGGVGQSDWDDRAKTNFIERTGRGGRVRQHNEMISIRTMQRYVHSPTFAPLPNELVVYWQRLGPFIAACLNH